MNKILNYFEKQAFGVCAWWGEKLGISSQKVRLNFIYFSFITLGSPLLIYLIMAFILEHKEYFKFRSKKGSIWEL
ncbi:PspC domain-containing protein [Luteibaculum oceani]|uniref:PspC domain-containing protein n=1 Tax=Luteibaculum oceani TaxID=1294296 RepID=A0A5C6VBK0_9FLAO|nr:PspC domain-containing protein [Luteibaculum oceani]